MGDRHIYKILRIYKKMDEEAIKKQAKTILDRFAKALEGIKTEEAIIERDESMREEGGEKLEINREVMFENAPKKKDDCIEAEKGGWVS